MKRNPAPAEPDIHLLSKPYNPETQTHRVRRVLAAPQG
jgi:hypothetical protein